MSSTVSVCSQGERGDKVMSNASWDRSHGRVPPLAIRLGTYPTPPGHQTCDLPPTTDIWWPTLKTCSNLSTWGNKHPPPPKQHLVVATEAHTVCKREVRILVITSSSRILPPPPKAGNDESWWQLYKLKKLKLIRKNSESKTIFLQHTSQNGFSAFRLTNRRCGDLNIFT